MKRLIFVLLFFLVISSISAQETYTIDGKEIKLYTEIDGEVDLLWNIIDGKYRYYIRRSDNTFIELTNTKLDRSYQQEYKTVLRGLSTDEDLNVDKVDLTLYDLGKFVDQYNQSVDSSYESQLDEINILIRLEGFAGISNSPFVSNPEDAINPQFGFSIELIDLQTFPRHALYLNGRHVLRSDEFDYSVSELALGYRYRIINKEKFSLYANIVFGTLSFISTNFSYVGPADELITRKIKETEFESPFKFGIGADYRISDHSFITLGYNEIFALLLDNSGNFSKNITIGYKVDL